MRIAGVRLADGRGIWADARDSQIAPLDEVTVRLDGAQMMGSISVSPEQLVHPPERIDGTIIEVHRRETPDEVCGDLPGSDMPPLGSEIRMGTVTGTVTAIDAVRRVAMITPPGGESVEIPIARLP